MIGVALAMTLVALLWFGLHYCLNSLMKDPDGIAKVTGSCGDTMEIALKFNGPRVEDVHCWTDGCAISKMCVETVGMLARGKNVAELEKIDTSAILERVGNLPDTHMHCAVLAETTLHKAVSVYKLKNPVIASCETGCRKEYALDNGLHHEVGASPAEKLNYVVYLFPSSNYVMKAERILKEFGIDHKIIPVPRHLSSNCGVCLRIPQDQQQRVSETLREKVSWEQMAVL